MTGASGVVLAHKGPLGSVESSLGQVATSPIFSLCLSGDTTEGLGQSSVITLPPATGVFQRHHGEHCARLPHERRHVPWV